MVLLPKLKTKVILKFILAERKIPAASIFEYYLVK